MCEDLRIQFESDMCDFDLDFTLNGCGIEYLKSKTRIAYRAFLYGYHCGLRG